ncbi:MAG: hypothetical protein ACKVP7_21475 [Hyphomicrobiaceae bacterium]
MAQRVADEVSRFLGYLHFDQLLNLDMPHYWGAPIYAMRAQSADRVSKPTALEADLPGRGAPLRLPMIDDQDMPERTFTYASTIEGPQPFTQRQLESLPVRFDTPQAVINAALDITYEPSLRGPINPTVTYTFGLSAGWLLDVVQKNALFDNDVMSDRLLQPDAMPPATDARAALGELVELGLSQVPAGLAPDWDRPSGTEHELLHSGDGLELGLTVSKGNPGLTATVPQNGIYVDGVRVSETGQSQREQSADLKEVAESILEEVDLDGDRGAPFEPQPVPVPADGFPFGPTGGVAQHVTAGNNELANVAAIYDLTDASASRIIRGDYYERNVIAQVNVLAETDGDLPSQTDIIEAAIAANHSGKTSNEASFVSDPGLLYGNIFAGIPGAANWHVDYIDGDLFDSTSLIQRNYLVDNDLSHSTQSQAHSIYTLGENDQINVLNLVDLGKAYDLIIIDGSFYKYNAIFQFNIALDANDISPSEADADVDSSGNRLSNDAAIIGVGGNAHVPLNSNAEALAEAIADKSTTLDYTWTIGLPGNGNDTFEVLYISGDYYAYNILLQTNIIADIDSIEQQGGDSDLVQTVSAAGNSASNAALIFDLESQSAYQFLGGTAYEESFLVQAELIIEPEDDGGDNSGRSGSGSGDDSLIGVLAALSEHDDNSGSGNGGESYDWGHGGHADVLGGLLH